MNAEDRENKVKYIMMTQIKGLGPVSQNALLDICGDIDRCFSVSSEDLLSMDDRKMVGTRRIKAFAAQRDDAGLRKRAEEILLDAESKGIHIVTRDDSSFPKRFSNIAEMPIMLYCKGELTINEYKESAGIVGARRCTQEGKMEAIEKATKAATEHKAVISGMAKGIDSYVHTAAIKAGAYTIAVLGNGPDICYPKEHQALYDSIASHCCIVSEYPPGTKPREYMFPIRNRIIAALSDELFVIDAGRNSGTITTVEKWNVYNGEYNMVSV